jgi:hypothetical protein
MTKRQLFLVAGALVLVGACDPLTAPFCETDEVTGEAFCASKSQAQVPETETPAPLVEYPETGDPIQN